MKYRVSFAVLAALSGSCFPAYAQRGAHPVAVAMARPAPAVIRMQAPAAAHGNVSVVRVGVRSHGRMADSNPAQPRQSTVRVVTGSGVTTTLDDFGINGFEPLTLQDLLNPTPGFGFDFTHLAAINRNLGVRALIDPVTQGELAIAERLLRETPVGVASPFFFGSGLGSTPVVVEEQQQQAQPPQVIVVQAPAAEQPQQTSRLQTEQQPPAASAPLPESGEFVLVRRNGSVIFAIGFAQRGEQVIYVTRQGTRRSISLNDLDVDATERMNADRGSSVQLSQ